jgi:hypothetical protein
MPFFAEIAKLLADPPSLNIDASSRIAVILSDVDIAIFESLLAKVPYENAGPLVRALLAASSMQRGAGLLDVVERVLELHKTALAYRDRSSVDESFH